MPKQKYRDPLQYIVEARNPDGSLNLNGEQPPIREGNYDEIADVFFNAHPEAQIASQDEITEWYHSKGWSFRKKYW